MSLKKILIVSGLVLGVVGAANAQLPNLTTNDVSEPAAADITISYVVALEGTIEVIPNLTLDVNSTEFIFDTIAPLGNVNVKTNYGAWDVIVQSRNGGRLESGGVPCVDNGWGGCLTGTGTSGDPLVYAGTNPDTAQLKISIALNRTNAAGQHQVYATSPAIAPTTTGLSFATRLAAVTFTAFETTGQTNSTIATGFRPYLGIQPGPGSTLSNYQTHGITFTILGGLDIPAAHTLDGNKNGTYEEVLSFTLVANY